jgi:hypothetical protein
MHHIYASYLCILFKKCLKGILQSLAQFRNHFLPEILPFIDSYLFACFAAAFTISAATFPAAAGRRTTANGTINGTCA